MSAYGIYAFICYTVVFYVGQVIIGHRVHARQIRAREAPGKLILQCAAMGFLIPAVLTMKDQIPIFAAMIIGAIVVILGLIVSMLGQRELGRYWVGGIGLHKDHKLITTGPYKYVRNPLYSGMLISALGLSIFGLNVFYTLSVFCFSGAFAIRVLGEEQELEKRFKKKYVAYKVSTGMFVPRIRK